MVRAPRTDERRECARESAMRGCGRAVRKMATRCCIRAAINDVMVPRARDDGTASILVTTKSVTSPKGAENDVATNSIVLRAMFEIVETFSSVNYSSWVSTHYKM